MRKVSLTWLLLKGKRVELLKKWATPNTDTPFLPTAFYTQYSINGKVITKISERKGKGESNLLFLLAFLTDRLAKKETQGHLKNKT